MLCPRLSRFPHGGYHRIYINAVVVPLSRWVAEEQAPVVLAVVRRGGFAMVDPSVRRLRVRLPVGLTVS